jgi:hypothetical protein
LTTDNDEGISVQNPSQIWRATFGVDPGKQSG